MHEHVKQDLFLIWKYITYRLYKNASRTSFVAKFCFLYSLFLFYCLVDIHIFDYPDYLVKSQRDRIIEVSGEKPLRDDTKNGCVAD